MVLYAEDESKGLLFPLMQTRLALPVSIVSMCRHVGWWCRRPRTDSGHACCSVATYVLRTYRVASTDYYYYY